MTIGDPLYLLAGGVFVAVGLLVGLTRRRHPPALGLAAYTLGLGVMYTLYWGLSLQHVVLPWILPLNGIAAAGLALLLSTFPRRVAKGERVDLLVPALLGIVFLWTAFLFEHDGNLRSLLVGPGATGILAAMGWTGYYTVAFVSVAAGFLLPLRARRLGLGDEPAMRSIGILVVALALLSPGGAFPGIVAAAQGEAPLGVLARALVHAVLIFLFWLPAIRGPLGRTARNIYLATVVISLAQGVVFASAGALVVQIGRVLAALILAYSVLAGHVQGLDVKVRFAISKSTLAAIFVAVFFVASEIAQQLFGAAFGGAYAGIIAAGALVFAMAPLQRAAERLAERAVPVDARERPLANGLAHEEAYRAAVRLALRGGITRQEELELARIADAHGLTAVRAHELRQEVEGQGSRAEGAA